MRLKMKPPHDLRGLNRHKSTRSVAKLTEMTQEDPKRTAHFETIEPVDAMRFDSKLSETS